MADNIWYKDWNKSKSVNDTGDVPFYRPLDLTPEEKEQACKNIGVASNDAIERLEDEFTDLRGDMATVSSDVASAVIDANSAVSVANNAVTAANAALASVSSYSTDLAAVSAKADTNSANIAGISAQVQTNVTNIASISGKNTNQDNQISTISGAVNGLTNNVNTVSAKVDTNASVISALSAAEANDISDINTLSGNLNTVSGIASSARQEALEAKNTANATSAFCQTNYKNLTSGWSAMQNDWSAFSAAEDAVITAATTAIPGQVSAEVSGQLSGKQDKLTSDNAGVNISISNAGVIDVKKGGTCVAAAGSVAIGYSTTASGVYALSHGENTYAGAQAHAEGLRTSAFASKSHTEGFATVATGAYAHAEGEYTSAFGQTSHTEGYMTFAGYRSHAEGNATNASGAYAHAEGQATIASGQASHAEGNATTALTNYTHAEGRNNVASGTGAHAEGYQTSAIGLSTHSEGEITIARGNESHAEGRETEAIGINSHAEGYHTSAVGERSHSEGSYTSAVGQYSHTEGYQTTAGQGYSHSEGRYTITDTQYQHVEGQYNAPATGALHVIGNGTSTAARSNIVETYTDRVVVNGNLINDTKDQVLAQFMFDQMPATQTEGKIITQKILPSGQYVINEYVVGNYEISKVGGFTGSQSPACTTPGGAILAWDGNVGQALRGQYTSNWTPSAWPTDKLPRNVYASANNLSWNQFASYNMNLKELPSGWYNSFTAYCNEPTTTLYHVAQMFKGCRNLSGDVKPWMDFVLTQSGAGQAGNPSREFYRKGMFALCSAVDNYATLSGDATYSAFFDAS